MYGYRARFGGIAEVRGHRLGRLLFTTAAALVYTLVLVSLSWLRATAFVVARSGLNSLALTLALALSTLNAGRCCPHPAANLLLTAAPATNATVRAGCRCLVRCVQ